MIDRLRTLMRRWLLRFRRPRFSADEVRANRSLIARVKAEAEAIEEAERMRGRE
jgi:hypothetical protein